MTQQQEDPIPGLLEALERAKETRRVADDELALAVLRRRQEGASVRALADQYDVPPTSVHAWTKRGESLRATGQRPRHGKVSVRAPAALLPVWLQWTLLTGILASVVLDVLDVLGY